MPHITKATGARLEFSLAVAAVAVKVWKTTDHVMYHRMRGGGAYVILSRQSVGSGGGRGGGGGAEGGAEGEACDSCQCSHISNTPMHDVHMLKVLVWTQ